MRIISGKYRGRNIITNDNHIFRPTTSKTREAIFSVLASGRFKKSNGESIIEKAIVMDLCCGSGSLGLEAISRGASKIIAIDIEQDSINVTKNNARAFGELDNFMFIRADARLLPKGKIIADVVFIDPPYEKDIIPLCLLSLHQQSWLKESSIIIAELDKSKKLENQEMFEIVDYRIYGKTKIYIFRYIGDNEQK